MKQLFGSLASPYVRRIRILLHNKDYQFIQVNIFDAEDRKKIEQYSPIYKIPILIDGDEVILDSLLITEYLGYSFDLQQKHLLNLINEANDAAIILFQMRKFGIDPVDKSALSQNQKTRVLKTLEYFDAKADLSEWDIPAQWLYCMLDWFKLRDVLAWEKNYSKLQAFHQLHQKRKEIIETAP